MWGITSRRRSSACEIDDTTKPEILRAYRRRLGLVPFVRDAFDATGHTPTLGSSPE
ncbi:MULTISPECIES: hypothetical protein [unclassified Spirillospora]|uniref:hypothetical protein n=1 Tax=unclassified Spirillospora TaxID=2642701 RepID=UPI00371EB8E8